MVLTRGWLLHPNRVFTLAALVLVVSVPACAADIVLERTAVEKLLKNALFKDRQERMYLADDPCYAYLEYPVVHLTGGRLHLSGHLSARVGTPVGGNCLGPGLASNFTVSAKPAFEGGKLILQDLRIDTIEDRWTDLLRGALSARLPTAVQFDLRAAVQSMFTTAPGQLQPVLENLTINEVIAEKDQLVARLNFRIRAK